MDQHFFNKTVWGLLLIAAGVLFLLHQTNLVQFDIGELFTTYWPVILIYFGLKGIVVHKRLDYGWGGSYVWNAFLALLGVYFLLRNLHVDVVRDIEIWQFIVPVLLILYGLSMLTGGSGRSRRQEEKERYREQRRQEREQRREERDLRREGRHRNDAQETSFGPVQEEIPPYDPEFERKIQKDFDQTFQEKVGSKLGMEPLEAPTQEQAGRQYTPPPPPPPPSNGPTYSNSSWFGDEHRRTVTRSNFIGDIHLGQDYWELEPTNVSHFIGDTVIDLTKARIPYGETKLTVSSFIGDVKVFVPNDIQVEVSVTASAFIGDMKVMDRHEGGLFRHMQHRPAHYGEAEKKIHLTVSMFIGDVFIKRVG